MEVKWYSAKELARSGLLPYKDYHAIINLINENKLKAIHNGKKGKGLRFYIPNYEVERFLKENFK